MSVMSLKQSRVDMEMWSIIFVLLRMLADILWGSALRQNHSHVSLRHSRVVKPADITRLAAYIGVTCEKVIITSKHYVSPAGAIID